MFSLSGEQCSPLTTQEYISGFIPHYTFSKMRITESRCYILSTHTSITQKSAWRLLKLGGKSDFQKFSRLFRHLLVLFIERMLKSYASLLGNKKSINSPIKVKLKIIGNCLPTYIFFAKIISTSVFSSRIFLMNSRPTYS